MKVFSDEVTFSLWSPNTGKEIEMDNDPQHGHSQLFLVRLWEKSSSDGNSGKSYRQIQDDQSDDSGTAWYGTVQHPVSGRTRHFKGRDGLTATLSEMLQAFSTAK
jgi:hypothetical protein